jgi:DNA-binding NarL/FixJ family response regulator
MKHLVVDDPPLVREALASVLRTVDPDATVTEAGTAAPAHEAVAADPALDLILLDLRLPDGDGLALLDAFSAACPANAVVMLSGERDEATVRRALDAGAAGFIPKSESREVLARATSLVLAGGVDVPREALAAPPAAASPPAVPGRPGARERPDALASLGLTERQHEVLELPMQGLSKKLICRGLDLSEPTVEAHVGAILRALKVASRTEAVVAVTRLRGPVR